MNVALGVGGGIAAYKAAELARALMERGFTVQVVMTARRRGIHPPADLRRAHRPQGAHQTCSAAGSAEDTLRARSSTSACAGESRFWWSRQPPPICSRSSRTAWPTIFSPPCIWRSPGRVVLAPAMNTNMWNHPATRENLRILRERGHVIVEPDDGAAGVRHGRPGPPGGTGGDRGSGCRLRDELTREPSSQQRSGRRDRADHRRSHAGAARRGALSQQPVQRQDGLRAGRRSALARGARVILVSGPVHLAPPRGVEVIHVQTAVEMRAGGDGASEGSHHDHQGRRGGRLSSRRTRPARRSRRPPRGCRWSSIRRPIFWPSWAARRATGCWSGFAAETENLVEEARRKLESKNCDMVVANLVSQEGIGIRVGRKRSGAGAAHRRDDSGASAPPRARSRTASSTK